MRKSRLVVSCLLLFSLAFLTGCAGYMEYLDRSYKANLNSFTRTDYTAGPYQVLGPVRAHVESLCVLTVYVEGKDGQGALWREAQEKYPGQVTGIKDVCVETEWSGVLPPVFSRIRTTYYGIAVRETGAARPTTPQK